jgi:hypothetical protein
MRVDLPAPEGPMSACMRGGTGGGGGTGVGAGRRGLGPPPPRLRPPPPSRFPARGLHKPAPANPRRAWEFCGPPHKRPSGLPRPGFPQPFPSLPPAPRTPAGSPGRPLTCISAGRAEPYTSFSTHLLPAFVEYQQLSACHSSSIRSTSATEGWPLPLLTRCSQLSSAEACSSGGGTRGGRGGGVRVVFAGPGPSSAAARAATRSPPRRGGQDPRGGPKRG